jgi:hypothetical protein
MTAVAGCLSTTVPAQTTDGADQTIPEVNPILLEADQTLPDPDVSPALRIDSQRRPPAPPEPPALSDEFRSIDGSANNPDNPDMGRAGTPLLRLLAPAYGDGVTTMAGAERPNPRTISSTVNAQPRFISNAHNASDFIWQWGQFLDHDLDLTNGTDPPESEAIPIPAGDPWFDPQNTGTAVIAFNRSLYDHASGSGPDNPRQQINELTAWIDASNVYGSDRERAEALRTLDGSGRLRSSAGNLLPFNTDGLPNAGGASPELFLAGDVRANEQLALTVMHTLFMREHNRLADQIAAANPQLSDDEIYERARRMVGAEMQVITYREFLPALLGRDALAPYRGYRPDIDVSISNVFSTASFRFGHSALSPTLLRLDRRDGPIREGHLALRHAFFTPQRLIDEGGIEPLLRGLAAQAHQAIDVFVVDDGRNFLFGPPGAGGFDLAALNIQRGRDHGLPG